MNGSYFVACGRVGRIIGRVHGSDDVYKLKWQDEPGERLVTLEELLQLNVMLFDSKEAALKFAGVEPAKPETINAGLCG